MKTPARFLQPAVAALVAALSLFRAANAPAQSGMWTNNIAGNASGSWAGVVNWTNGVIADGADNTADFSTLDLLSNSIVTLDGARTIGHLIFADVTPDTNWTVNAGTPTTSAVTLDVTAGSPAINVVNRLTTFGASIFGFDGFTKTGAGTLRLNAAGTNATGMLTNLVVINQGILQIGNAVALGVNGNQNSENRVVCTNGGTIEIINTIQPNNKHLMLAGAGAGGTNGSLYANISSGSTRWGLSAINDSGVSANSSAAFPAINLMDNTTIRIDGNWSNQPTALFAIGYIAGTNSVSTNDKTLTITGGGRLSGDRGMNGVTNLILTQGGAWMPNVGAFGSILNYSVASGCAILNNQNNCFSSAANIQLDAGSFFDINWRGNGVVGNDNTTYTQNIGYLNGAGTITTGSRGNTNTQTLSINGANAVTNVFSGPIGFANGKLSLVKNGAATQVLSGTNTYNGGTTNNAGVLLVNGLHTGGGEYTVAAAATLGGLGTIVPLINLAGTLLAGDNGGTLTVSNVIGAGNVIASNANLRVNGQLNTSVSGTLASLYLSNSVTTINLQGGIEASIYASSVNVDNTNNTLNVLIANPAVGQFPLIGNLSAIGGLNGFAGLKLQTPAGVGAYLSNNTANFSIDIVVTNIPALVWRGTPTGDWLIGGSANWLNGATPSAYTETAGAGPFVIFNDTAAGTASVNLTTNVNPKGITVDATSKTYSITGPGAIVGTNSWVKTGSSTFTVANTGPNSFNGGVTIAAGAVQLGNGGVTGDLGTAAIINNSTLIFNRSDNVSFANSITGTGSLVKTGGNTVTLTGVGDIGGSIAANAGTLALGPAGTITVSGDVTGGGAFGVNGAGTVKLSSGTITYSGGSVIEGGGTLEFDSVFPPSGNITDNGTLALGVGGTISDIISGTGGVTLLNGSSVTLAGANTYSGPTRVLGGGALMATAATYPAASILELGSSAGGADIGSATFTSGDPALGGLTAGGNSTSPGNPINLSGSGQTLTINGNLSVGNVSPVGASVLLPVTGTGATLTVNTNGGVIQIGLGATGSGVNPDNVFVDLSGIDNFIANLGTNGTVNLGTLDGNPGPPAGATVVNWFNLAAVSNNITAGLINIGAGGRQLVPELRLGAGNNVLNVNTLALGQGQVIGGRDGGYLHFLGGTGDLRLRGSDGVSRAAFTLGNNPVSGTGASITNTVDLTGHQVDLLVSTLIIGNYNNAGIYYNSFSFDTGVLDAQSTSLSVIRNNNANAPLSGSVLSIGGGTASLGAVSLTASAAFGTLNISSATVTVSNITSAGSGVATLSLDNSTLNTDLGAGGNPITAPIAVDSLIATGTVNLGVQGTNFSVGQFPLLSYTGGIGGGGYAAFNLNLLPAGCSGYLSNNAANLSVDVVITSAPVTVNPNPTNITFSAAGGNLNLSWPSTHLGWILQAQTNSRSVGLANNWFDVPNSAALTATNFTVNATNPTVFFRLRHP